MEGPVRFSASAPGARRAGASSARATARRSSVRARHARERRLVRRHVDAYNRRDLAAMRTLNHPEIEVDWSASPGPHAGVYRGIDAVIGFYREWYSMFEHIEVELGELRAYGGIVLAPNVAAMRGRDGIEVIARSVLEFTVRNGEVVRVRLLPRGGSHRAAA